MAATGPSLTLEDLHYARGKAALLVVNDAYRLAPWADAMYACDPEWWDHHAGASEFKGERWTQDLGAAKKWKLKHVPGKRGRGFGLSGGIHFGDNSGYQAINLALLLGAESIVLLGFDMQQTGGKRHYFGDHPGRMNKRHPYGSWLANFDEAARMHPTLRIVNATRETALTAWPCVALETALAD